MPLYEYDCSTCHQRTEKIQKFSDPEITACPRCGGLLKRVLSAPAIAFKGSGWYADGYGNPKPASSGDSKSDATTSDTTTSGADAKPSGAAGNSPAPAPAAPSSSTPVAVADKK